MLRWAKEERCSLILSSAGYAVEDNEADAEIIAIGSTESALERIRKAGISILEHGSVSGIPAILLNEGRLEDIDVIVLLVKVLKDVPDFRAAALLSEVLGKFAPSCQCNRESLLVEAEKIEKNIKKIHEKSKIRSIYG